MRIFLTMCTFRRRPLFTSAGLVGLVRRELLRTVIDYHVELVAYCFMPDHLHALLEGVDQRAELEACLACFRRRAGYAYRRLERARLWQDGYFDRSLRSQESTAHVVAYILANPTRAGLCADPHRYPYSGSSRYTMDELMASLG